MFSSNQKLEVSGSFDQIAYALNFAMHYSGRSDHISKEEAKRGCKRVYQITKDGKYCIGWSFGEVPNHWTEFPFLFDVKIVSKIIEQHLEYSQKEPYGPYDGLYEKGFLMKAIRHMGDEWEGIKEPFYGIVSFEPYYTFYSK